ncbi:MAG: hypothetical protein NTW04_03965 [Elusimicrobia bacterium]|nr:hypothetical protein [Elusimicrobiota bacterium]
MLHVFVLIVVLITIAAVLVQLIFGRYAVATKVHRTVSAQGLIEGCMARMWADWDKNGGVITTLSSSCGYNIGTASYTINYVVTPGASVSTVTFSVDYSQL